MKVGIYDLETSSLDANFGIVLCGVVKEYGRPNLKTFRADNYKAWKEDRGDNSELIRDLMTHLNTFDVLVAHNGEWFDKKYLLTLGLRYEFSDLVRAIRHKKTIDPVLLSRRYLKLGRNALGTLIDHLGTTNLKTPLEGRIWRKAIFNGDKHALGQIVKHCEADVRALEDVYDRMRPLIDRIDNKGSQN